MTDVPVDAGNARELPDGPLPAPGPDPGPAPGPDPGPGDPSINEFAEFDAFDADLDATPDLDADRPIFSRRRSHARRAPRPRRTRVLVILGVLILPFIVAGAWFWYQVSPPGDPGAAVTVTVEKGWGIADIGDALEAHEVIGSSTAFGIYTRLTGAGPFEAGTYRMQRDLGVSAAVSRLEAGPETSVIPTVKLDVGAPGLTLDQIGDRVAKIPGRSKEKFLALAHSDAVRSKFEPADIHNLEGLTAPAVYEFRADATEEQMLQQMVEKFDADMTGINLAEGAAKQGITPYEAIIIASLIQREAGVADDRPDIAAVVYNRLKAGMPLQIDATVVYARGGGAGSPTKADLAIDSPYNTYRYPGLPPTPIATVTTEAVVAAINPTPNVGYRYYVVIDASGRHAFADTYEEHLKNIEIAKQKGLL